MINFIEPTSTCSMNNAYFVSFHQSIAALLENNGIDSLGIQDSVFNAYKADIAKLNDAVLRTMGSDKTAIIADYDTQRDKLFRYVRNVLINTKFSSDPEIAALYETALTKILKVYPSKIATESNQEESAHIAGFIIDVDKFFHNQLVKLGIDGALKALETANNNFQKTFLERSDELASIEDGATIKYRAAVEESFALISVTMNYFASRTDSTDEVIMARCNSCSYCIGIINQFTSEVKQSIKLGKALSKNGNGNANPNPNANPNANGGNSGGGLGDLG